MNPNIEFPKDGLDKVKANVYTAYMCVLGVSKTQTFQTELCRALKIEDFRIWASQPIGRFSCDITFLYFSLQFNSYMFLIHSICKDKIAVYVFIYSFILDCILF